MSVQVIHPIPDSRFDSYYWRFILDGSAAYALLNSFPMSSWLSSRLARDRVLSCSCILSGFARILSGEGGLYPYDRRLNIVFIFVPWNLA